MRGGEGVKVSLSEKEELGLFLQLDGIADDVYKCDGYEQSGKDEQSDEDEQQPYDDEQSDEDEQPGDGDKFRDDNKSWDHDKSVGDVSFNEDLYK